MKKNRREFIKNTGIAGAGLMGFNYLKSITEDPVKPPSVQGNDKSPIPEKTLHVAAVQMHSVNNLSENADRISKTLLDCAAMGVRVAAFPECALSGYSGEVTKLDSSQIREAELKVADTCRKAGIYAIIGMPYRTDQKLFNSAAVISPEGNIIERYHKVQLAESWPDPGDHLSVFNIDDIPCSIIICHDERYPELVRLPVLAGAKVIFYISHESNLRSEKKLDPYRAQIQARAVENNVFVVHSNAPANQDASGSHGQSRIIAPDGNIIQEASFFDEEVLTSLLDLSKATRNNATKSMTRGPLKEWWQEGLKYVKTIG
jgi:predicted amidohydrolase